MQALAAAAGYGPYFAVQSATDGAGWLPLRAMLDDPVRAERIEAVAESFARRAGVANAEPDRRACASVYFLGLAARLLSAPLWAATQGRTVGFGPDEVWWRAVDSGPIPIAVTSGAVVAAESTAQAAAGLDALLADCLAPLVAGFAGVSPTVLWGNVGSALAGAAGQLSRGGSETAVPIVAALLARPGPLHEAGRFGGAGRFYARASCCLLYRLPGGGMCGDCLLLPRPGDR